ncbi:hypothetical protein pb186bvf_013050 [Paramecium bursaria]
MDEEQKRIGFEICEKLCVQHPDQIKVNHPHHTVSICLKNCAIKFQNAIRVKREII